MWLWHTFILIAIVIIIFVGAGERRWSAKRFFKSAPSGKTYRKRHTAKCVLHVCLECVYECVYRPTWIMVGIIAVMSLCVYLHGSPRCIRLPQIQTGSNFIVPRVFQLSRIFSNRHRGMRILSFGYDICFFSILLNVRRINTSMSRVSQTSRLRSPHATRYSIVCYYSCITRYRRVHVALFARLDNLRGSVWRGAIFVRNSAFPRANCAGWCEKGDERRRLYIKIAFKVGKGHDTDF